MSSCQFIHLEVYARVAGSAKKGGHDLDSIVAEAERHPSACLHVAKPRPPTLLYGSMPSKAAEKASAWAAQACDSRGRRLRRDGLCLLAGVISLEQQRIEDWPAFRQATLKWLIDFFGDRLVSVIEHTDEENPHLHFYCVPRARERFECLHPGRQAAQEARNAGQLKGLQNGAYKAAMRQFQDIFFARIARYFGLTRIGPARRRLTRKAWKEEQAVANLYAFARKADAATPGPIPAAPLNIKTDIDWEPIKAIARNATKHLIGKDTYSREQLELAARAAVKAGIRAARIDEQTRWQPVLDHAKGTTLLRQIIEDRDQYIQRLKKRLELLNNFTKEEIHQRYLEAMHKQPQMPTEQPPPSPQAEGIIPTSLPKPATSPHEAPRPKLSNKDHSSNDTSMDMS